MQASSNKSQTPPHKIKNILIRHSCSTQIKLNSFYQHPEAPYMIKYAPKYYHSLTLEVTPQSSLLLKVKKIKRLKKFTGLFKKECIPQKLWVNLLGNTRKEMEELPLIICTKKQPKLSKSFWKKLNLQKIKLFPNVKRILLEKEFKRRANDNNDCFSIINHFVRYLGNMRSLKSLEISVDKNNDAHWFITKLNRMSKLLSRLEVLALNRLNFSLAMLELLLRNKKVLSHLTGLRLSDGFNEKFVKILQRCKNLKSLSLAFDSRHPIQNTDILSLLACLQSNQKLVSLELEWPSQVKDFWSHFKPPSTLRSLKLKFFDSNLVNSGLVEGGVLKDEDLVRHWEDIADLDFLEFQVGCGNCKNILLVRPFITQVLKKVRKLRAFKWRIVTDLFSDRSLTYEPFVIEEVAHLYESLEKFDYTFTNTMDIGNTKLDLGKMKPFRNLKEVKLGGNRIIYENIDKMVDLLQENKGSALEVEMEVLGQPDGVKEILKKIAKRKRMDWNLKMRIDLKFKTKDFVGLLEELYEKIEPIKMRKGLEICLSLVNLKSSSQILTKSMIGTLEKYLKIRNSIVRIWNRVQHLELIKIYGEKEQFYIDDI